MKMMSKNYIKDPEEFYNYEIIVVAVLYIALIFGILAVGMSEDYRHYITPLTIGFIGMIISIQITKVLFMLKVLNLKMDNQ